MRGAASTSGDRGAEPRERLRRARADRAAADDDHRRRQVGGLEHVAVGPERGVGQAVDRGSGGRGAGVEHDAARGDVAGAVHLDHTGVDEPAVAPHEAHAGLLEALDGDRVVPVVGGLVADPGVHDAPVGGDLGGAGQGADPAGVGEQVRGPDRHLRGDAAPVGALAADQALVDADDVQAGLRGLGGEVLATGPEADDDEVHGGVGAHGCQPSTRAVPTGRAVHPRRRPGGSWWPGMGRRRRGGQGPRPPRRRGRPPQGAYGRRAARVLHVVSQPTAGEAGASVAHRVKQPPGWCRPGSLGEATPWMVPAWLVR